MFIVVDFLWFFVWSRRTPFGRQSRDVLPLSQSNSNRKGLYDCIITVLLIMCRGIRCLTCIPFPLPCYPSAWCILRLPSFPPFAIIVIVIVGFYGLAISVYLTKENVVKLVRLIEEHFKTEFEEFSSSRPMRLEEKLMEYEVFYYFIYWVEWIEWIE